MTMARVDYGEIIAQALQGGAAGSWDVAFRRSLAGRSLMALLYSEGLQAAEAARERGARLIFNEWLSADRFDLKTNGRTVGFARAPGEEHVTLHREGFPPGLVPIGQEVEAVTAPLDPRELPVLAQRQVAGAVTLLYQQLP